MASQRKRIPVAFRPRLSASLALSLLSSKRSTDLLYCQSVNIIGVFQTTVNVGLGPPASVNQPFRCHCLT